MIQILTKKTRKKLKDYEGYAHLVDHVRELEREARHLVPHLRNRKIWMLNSTAEGGGVAEMLPNLVAILRELGVNIRWLVMNSSDSSFFSLTKRIHNLIHDFGEPVFSDEDRAIYRKESLQTADDLSKLVSSKDILIVHDPQPLGAGAELKRRIGLPAVWRCHIGLDMTTPATTAAWEFLRDDAVVYDYAVFSAPEYIPPFLAGRASIIHPAIDPLSHKNRDFSAHKLVGILSNAGLISASQPVLTPQWRHKALRLQPDGSFLPVNEGIPLGLLYRPTISQISRWDNLKGWKPLLKAFIHMKRTFRENIHQMKKRDLRRLEIIQLVLAGPDPKSIQDDPEGQIVLRELCDMYLGLKPEEQADIALLVLPMASSKQNHLMVNAIQRCSTVVVQNSLREGFGLTATEAMWKRVPVLGTNACGLRQQIRDEMDGILTKNPSDHLEISENLYRMLSNTKERDFFGRNAQRRVHENFLIFTQARQWLHKLTELISQ